MTSIIDRLKRPGHTLAGLVRKLWFLFPDDAQYLKMVYRLEMGHKLDLDHPQTFTEKLQWLKIHDRKPEYTLMVDKITAKEYVAEKIGEQYIIPTLGVWNHFDDIDFTQLPQQFVLKTNHGSGGSDVVICRDKDKLDMKAARQLLENSLKRNGYNKYREWPYKNVERKIFAEQLLVDYDDKGLRREELTDYKFYCFNGEPKFCQVIKDRKSKETIDFFDMEWNHQEFYGLNPKAKQAKEIPTRPRNLRQMADIARTLSANLTFCRIDLYEVSDREYFGEITFYPSSGFGTFTPDKYNDVLGKMVSLSGSKWGG